MLVIIHKFLAPSARWILFYQQIQGRRWLRKIFYSYRVTLSVDVSTAVNDIKIDIVAVYEISGIYAKRYGIT